MEITGISFEYPQLLWYLVVIPIFIGAYVYNLKFKRKEALLFSNFESLEHVIGRTFLPSYTLQIVINVLILLLLILSAAGLTLWYSGPVAEADFAILIDSSASMSAEDIPPSRLEAAKAAAISFVESLPAKSKVAIISFGGVPFVEQPLTEDLSEAESAIANINLKAEGGTDLSSALVTAANTLSISEHPKVAILITDGASTVGLPIKDGLDFVKSNHISVHTVGIGTEEGGAILNTGTGDRDTTLHEDTLIAIAGATLGRYHRVRNSAEFTISYDEVVESSVSKINIKLSPLLISIVIILMGVWWTLTFTKFSRIP